MTRTMRLRVRRERCVLTAFLAAVVAVGVVARAGWWLP